MLRSEAMFLTLSNLTKLSLHALFPTSDSESEDCDSDSSTGKVQPGKRVSTSSTAEAKQSDTAKRRRLSSKGAEKGTSSDLLFFFFFFSDAHVLGDNC